VLKSKACPALSRFATDEINTESPGQMVVSIGVIVMLHNWATLVDSAPIENKDISRSFFIVVEFSR
jgi:hypothetical protein